MKHSPLPWTTETYHNRDCIHEVMKDANDKMLFDTANSDVIQIECD